MNQSLNHMKEEYNNMTASNELKARVAATIKEQKSRKIRRIAGAGAAACVLMTFIASLNLSPAFAATVSEVPGMNGIVKVLTLGRYSVENGGFHADIVTPQIKGLLDKELEEKLNQDFKENANAVIAAFEKDMEELKKESPDGDVHYGIDFGYTIRTNNDKILALDVYEVNTVASSSTVHKFYTIDKKTGKQITLESLFREGTDYVGVLSKYLKAEMKRQNEKGENVYWIDDPDMGSFQSISKAQGFYLNNDGNLVICFDKYEIAPGSSGSPEFVIPNTIIQTILKK